MVERVLLHFELKTDSYPIVPLSYSHFPPKLSGGLLSGKDGNGMCVPA